MQNKHSSDGLAEDVIRSAMQIGCAELHAKTLYEKASSELSEGLYDDDKLGEKCAEMERAHADMIEYAQARRDDMLYLYELYGGKGDKKQWCMVKHLMLASYTAFEAWQASEDDQELLIRYEQKNRMLIRSLSRFLGTDVTSCASCFADMLKGVETDG